MPEPKVATAHALEHGREVCRIRVDDRTVTVHGDLDADWAPRLRTALERVSRQAAPDQFVLDLSHLGSLDSSAISVLFDHADRLRLVLAPDAAINRVLSLCGLLAMPHVAVNFALSA